jgi:hypothetical protein
MAIYLATQTVTAIERAIAADQGAAYRQNEQKVLPHIGDAYQGKSDPFRKHLGASSLGGECGRAIWYGFHWATVPQFEGRTLRLFNRGHLEEGRFIAALLTIGVQIYQQDENGKQYRISDVGGHLGGSGDGVGIGVPDVPVGTPVLLEFKTHNDASFSKLAGKDWNKYIQSLLKESPKAVKFDGEGVRAAKFEHYVQVQLYMHKMGLPAALYMAVNKNDDAIYAEILMLDTAIAEQFLDRGRKIIMMREAPKRINESPGWFACKWCDHYEVCHKKGAPARNCRTCVHAVARDDGHWYCTKPRHDAAFGDNPKLSTADQYLACDHYKPIE